MFTSLNDVTVTHFSILTSKTILYVLSTSNKCNEDELFICPVFRQESVKYMIIEFYYPRCNKLRAEKLSFINKD